MVMGGSPVRCGDKKNRTGKGAVGVGWDEFLARSIRRQGPPASGPASYEASGAKGGGFDVVEHAWTENCGRRTKRASGKSETDDLLPRGADDGGACLELCRRRAIPARLSLATESVASNRRSYMKNLRLSSLGIVLLFLTGCATTPQAIKPAPRRAHRAEIAPTEAAGLIVISAVYGSGDKFADVTPRVNDLLRDPKAYFWAKPEWLKADPTPGWNKALVIVYELDGNRRIFTTGEGGTVSVTRLRKSAEAKAQSTKKKPAKQSSKRSEPAPKKSAEAKKTESNAETPVRWRKLEVVKEAPVGQPFVKVEGEQFLNTGYVRWSEGLRLGDVEAAGGYVSRGAVIIEVLVFRDGKEIFNGRGPASRVRSDLEPIGPALKPEAPLLEPGDRVVARQVMG